MMSLFPLPECDFYLTFLLEQKKKQAIKITILSVSVSPILTVEPDDLHNLKLSWH
jgi:hypothetical protein